MLRKQTIWFWALAACFACAINLHIPDLGETYVSRNLFVWAWMALALAALWWRPIINGDIYWQTDWLIGLSVPILGAILILLINIFAIGDFHFGYYLMPVMLAIVALFVVGILQYNVKAQHCALALTAMSLAFVPQYLMHLISTNPVVFFPVTISLHQVFFKTFAGFGQYNLYGSFLVSLVLLTMWAAICLPLAMRQRLILLVLLSIFALDVPSLNSKTAILGLTIGISFLALHIYQQGDDKAMRRRAVQSFAVLGGAMFFAWLFLYFGDGKASNAYGWEVQGTSVQTRYAMWVVAWNAFLEAPLLGHGVGNFTTVYTDHFARYGLTEGLVFYPTVSLPHNLVMHLLAETGLVGTLLILGPFIWLGVTILRHHPHRWLVVALTAPMVIHSQLEYPYIASGGHYLLFALGLVAGVMGTNVLSRSVELPATRSARYFMLTPVLAIAAVSVFVSLSLQLSTYRATMSFARQSTLPLADYARLRYAAPDLSHPIIGQRMRAMADLVLARKAIEAGNKQFLGDVVIPSLERNVLPVYNNKGVWETMMRVYFEANEFDKAYKMAIDAAKFDPAQSKLYIEILDRSMAQLEAQINSSPNPETKLGSSPRPQ